MWINDKDKLIFIRIPKTAGTSIQSSLDMNKWRYISKQESINFDPYHMNQNDIKLEKFEDYNFFAVHRNPWDRMLSYYMFYLKLGEKYLERKDSLGDWGRRLHKELINQGFAKSLSKNGYFGSMYYIEKEKKPIEILNCCSWMQHGEWLPFKKLDKFKKYGIIIQKNENKTKHMEYQEYYDADSILCIEKYFEEDIKKFNYSFV